MGADSGVKALTFDLFGTILDLGGSLRPSIEAFLCQKGSDVEAEGFWNDWRARQRIEQYQDTTMMLGHCGYLEAARSALVYTIALNGLEASADEVAAVMKGWQTLSPFPEVVAALERLKARYRLVVLSNGEPHFLDHLVKNRVKWAFDNVISVSSVGAFKPHPAVYRRAARDLDLEVGECMMVSANAFDVVGARACGLQAAFVQRYAFPYDDSPYRPTVIVNDFTELADAIA